MPLLGRRLLLAFAVVLATLLATALALIGWAQSEGSLASGLQWAAHGLPADQQLEVHQVTGSLAQGGHIASLRWRQGSLQLTAEDLELRWDWRALLGRQLRLSQVRARSLHISDTGPARPGPWTALDLPLRLDLQLAVQTLHWDGPPDLVVQQLQAHYVYDGTLHRVEAGQATLAAGHYQFHGQLQARGAMDLKVQLEGLVQGDLGRHGGVVTAQAEASVQGTLGGPDALLELTAQLQPQPRDNAASAAAGSMRASLLAHLAPAQAQPLQSAQAHWSGLDLAAFWPQLPHSQLSGQLAVQPVAQGWSASVQVQNASPGTLDQQRLPLESLQASLLYAQGQWRLRDLQARGAGGSVQAQGALAGSPQRWSAQARVRGLQMRGLDTRWAAALMDGTLSAQQQASGWTFTLQAGAQVAGLGTAGQTHTLALEGAWQAPQLQLNQVLVQSQQAQLRGHVTLDTASRAAQGQLQLHLPGGELTLDGALEPTRGQGSLRLLVSDFAALGQALQQWPLPGLQLPQTPAGSSLDVQALWQGGWDNLALKIQGQAELLARPWRGQVDARLALASGQALVALNSLQLSQSDWQADLSAPVQLHWRSASGAPQWQLDAGSVRVHGPLPGEVALQWQSAQGTVQPGGAWHTQGRWSGLPQAWLERLGSRPLASLGLRGDLMLGGQWDVSGVFGGGATQVLLELARTDGDLQLLAQEAGKPTLAAGLSQARLQLELRGESLHARLVWASAAAGNATLDFSTRVQTEASGRWRWAADAPVQASLQASVPRVGVWSVLAPPGWRVQGSLDADLGLSGSRAAPQWRGSVQARDMALRAVVEGIDLSQGSVQLRLQGQHIEILDLSCSGAGGTSGGRLQASGSVDWAPQATGGVFPGLRMVLDAQAKALRVSARADQRLVVSGQLQAALRDTVFSLRGNLVADQALFLLPEDDAPRLGADVLVRPAQAQLPLPSAPALPAARAGAGAGALGLDVLVTLDPGPKFQLQGHGLDTRLAGQVTLRNEGRSVAPRLSGELHTVSGSYRAYGQALDIESGTLRFSGPYDNPALDILAVRPNLQQKVGVQVSGTAQLPVVRLWSDPDLPDLDKLSWLVLGRAGAAGGAETALLQQAALALWSGKGHGGVAPWTSLLGLDEVSLGEMANVNPDGSSSATTSATVKVGKRLSRDFYVAYERSLAGTLGTFYLFYDLSRRLTLRGESGQQKAADLIYTLRFD